jgi:hypothetical protein
VASASILLVPSRGVEIHEPAPKFGQPRLGKLFDGLLDLLNFRHKGHHQVTTGDSLSCLVF